MPVIIFHPEARQEFREAANYYEGSRSGLGDLFIDAVERAIKLVLANPFGWRKIRGEARRCLVRRFPYGVIYVVDENQIFILAVMHLHRKPDYWVTRLDDMP